jgi:hypothetical protein
MNKAFLCSVGPDQDGPCDILVVVGLFLERSSRRPGNLIVPARLSSVGTTPTISGVNDNIGNTYVEAGAVSLRTGSTVRWE